MWILQGGYYLTVGDAGRSGLSNRGVSAIGVLVAKGSEFKEIRVGVLGD